MYLYACIYMHVHLDVFAAIARLTTFYEYKHVYGQRLYLSLNAHNRTHERKPRAMIECDALPNKPPTTTNNMQLLAKTTTPTQMTAFSETDHIQALQTYRNTK
eukprot:GHVS01019408.1.p1 GENE.GHVS01019408.1~~GHVS01019408.1.p1  ORF type:complete len:103 (+),score=0.18 GHVS01019408.1:245-553(+)